MIIVINGPLGIGKTSVAWALNAHLAPCVMLDGDYVGAVEPFEIHDAMRVTYLYRTLAHLVAYHQREGGYRNFVIDYVFETPESLAELLVLLRPLDPNIRVFRLTCTLEKMVRRIQARGSGISQEQVGWEVSRGRELMVMQEAAAQRGFLGTIVDTSTLDPEQTARVILQQLAETRH